MNTIFWIAYKISQKITDIQWKIQKKVPLLLYILCVLEILEVHLWWRQICNKPRIKKKLTVRNKCDENIQEYLKKLKSI